MPLHCKSRRTWPQSYMHANLFVIHMQILSHFKLETWEMTYSYFSPRQGKNVRSHEINHHGWQRDDEGKTSSSTVCFSLDFVALLKITKTFFEAHLKADLSYFWLSLIEFGWVKLILGDFGWFYPTYAYFG